MTLLHIQTYSRVWWSENFEDQSEFDISMSRITLAPFYQLTVTNGQVF